MRFMLIATLCLAGCGNRPEPQAAPHHGGRYLGVGTYPAGRMWSRQVTADRPADAAAATIADDEQIIVVVDSRTGEVRQCGNLSGRCIATNPWGRTASVTLTEHAADLDRTDQTAPARRR